MESTPYESLNSLIKIYIHENEATLSKADVLDLYKGCSFARSNSSSFEIDARFKLDSRKREIETRRLPALLLE
ncbi:hypothetical protein RRG08_065483 [Elysia crispata]|uniref:Uncharacterized protein n=1 Tax=Elysia crispata TaxID=231223 RepID=A0AAE1ARE3_9GAST|nr:hypothetical protein RRG08_065483 [Elysia crispata]